MIQHITQEQFEQLTEHQHLIYVDWAVGQMTKDGDYTKAHRSAHDLIQFIDEHVTNRWLMEHDKERNIWRVRARFPSLYTEQPELIDALWEAAKLLMEQIPLQGEGGGEAMPTMQISGPYLREYPTIIRELKRLHISLHDVRYVEIITGEIVFRHSNREPFGSMQFNPQATAILHSDKRVELTGVTLEKCIPRLHNGHIGDGKTVRYKKKVWNEDVETYMPGIRLSSRTLTVHQALSLLEWLEQERGTLEQKVQEEQSAPMQG